MAVKKVKKVEQQPVVVDALDKIVAQIKARFPCIYVLTHEEERFVEHLRTRLEKEVDSDINIMEWSSTNGLRADSGSAVEAATCDVNRMLLAIEEEKTRSCIYILRSMGMKMDDAQVLRRMKDIIINYRLVVGDSIIVKMLVIVDATFPFYRNAYMIPPAIEKDVVVFNYPRMTGQEIREYLDEEYDSSIVTMSDDDREQVVRASLMLTRQEIDNAWSLSFINHKTISPKVVHEEKKNILRHSHAIKYYEPSFGLESVGGLERLKEYIKEVGIYWTPAGRALSLPMLSGLLLVGITGTGKTMISKALGSEWGIPVLFFDMGALFSSGVGDSERNAREMTSILDSAAPCIAVFDEMEKAVSGYRSSAQSDAGTTNRVMATILTWMEEHKSSVFVVATCNDIRPMPPELVGRFDERFFVPLPGDVARREIFTIHAAEYAKVTRDVIESQWDIDALVQSSKNRTGRELMMAVKAGVYKAASVGKPLNMPHILSALNEKVPVYEAMKEEMDALKHWVGFGVRPDGKKDGVRARFATIEDEKVIEEDFANVVKFENKE